MKLSIIIPAHNEEGYLGACLDSIFREARDQAFQFEVIVVVNASTDRTEEIARSYKGVRVLEEPLKGTNRARQRGFEAARGELIANLDADTILTPGWYDTVLREFSEDPKLVALSGPYIYHDLPPRLRLWPKIFYALAYPVYNLHKLKIKTAAVMGGNVVVRRSALQKIGGYNLAFAFHGDDTDTASRLSAVGQVKFRYDFNVYSSGRRLVQEGMLASGVRYAINYLWATLFKKPFSKNHKDIRLDAPQ